MLPSRNAVSENNLANATTALSQNYAVIWLDHSEARVIRFNSEMSEVDVVRPAHPADRRRVTADCASDPHGIGDLEFYRNVAKACDEVDAVLLAGHSIAKMELVKYLHSHSPQIFAKLPCKIFVMQVNPVIFYQIAPHNFFIINYLKRNFGVF